MSYNEVMQRGTAEFPIQLYHVDKNFVRYEMASHWHREMELIRVSKGTLNIRLGKREYIAKKDDVIIINPETVHCGYCEDNGEYECIVLHMELFDNFHSVCKNFVDALCNHEYMLKEYYHNPHGQFKTVTDMLFDSMVQKEKGYQFKVIGALYELFGIITNDELYYISPDMHFEENKNMPKLKKVLTYIRSHYDKSISLYDMANHINMSPKYFCFFFKNMTRKTPSQYVNLYRVEQAAKRLVRTDMSVTEIALSCGFNDLSYFIKTFKLLKGVTPAKFRKNQQDLMI